MKLDSLGRCCGRKTITYEGHGLPGRQKFCARCHRSYDYDTGKQRENWAWKRTQNGEFIRVAPPPEAA